MRPFIARAAIGLGLGAALLSSSFYRVDPWERAVVFDRLRRTCDTTGEGIHFNIPIVQKPFIWDIRSRPVTLTCSSLPTKDSHSVDLTAHVFFRPDISHLSQALQTLGPDCHLKLRQICLTTLASAISNLNADQLGAELPTINALLRDSLIRGAREHNIVVEDVFITNVSYDLR
ncbi:hypothetical protein MRB53_031841 [Persea americana]|uniref:Uncharacterized protein n=1 Tax=Persea americana TaxID=3435 RepID=A0ACC2KRC7_PERAE|nr:hypothetical protein MRB53_031841 [Persea americana]